MISETGILKEKHATGYPGCNPQGGAIWSDDTAVTAVSYTHLTDLERCSDHAINLAYALKERPSEMDAPKII